MPNLIQIKQHKIAIGNKYDISVNGMLVLKGSRSLFKFYPVIAVSPAQGGEPLFTIQQFYSLLRPAYVFQFGPNKYDLTTVSWWKRHYQIHMGKDVFDIYGHRGRKVSVFLNNKQVAWFESAAITFFSGDEYNIHASSDVSVDWLIAIALFWDSYYNRGNKGMVNIKFGHLIQKQQFDKNWVPA